MGYVKSYLAFLAFGYLLLGLLIVFGSLPHDTDGWFDSCFIDRFSVCPQGKCPATVFSQTILEPVKLFLLFVFVVQLAFAGAPAHKAGYGIRTGMTGQTQLHSSLDWPSVFSSVYASLWFMNSYCVCLALKTLLGDQRCSRHDNSVSGHYAFHTYILLTCPFLMVRLKRDPRHLYNYVSASFLKALIKGRVQKSTYALLTTYWLICVVCELTLLDTALLGYHTPRQMTYGTLFGLFIHTCLVLVFSRDISKTLTGNKIHSTSPRHLLSILAIYTIAAMAAGHFLSSAGLTVLDYALCLGTWMILLGVYVWRLPALPIRTYTNDGILLRSVAL